MIETILDLSLRKIVGWGIPGILNIQEKEERKMGKSNKSIYLKQMFLKRSATREIPEKQMVQIVESQREFKTFFSMWYGANEKCNGKE